MTYSVWYHGTTQENVASIPAKGLPLAMTAEPESWPFVTGQRVLHHPAGKGAGDGGGTAGDTQLLVDVFQVGAHGSLGDALAAALAGLACACLALAVTAPAGFAQALSSPGGSMPAAWVPEALLRGEDLASPCRG